MDMPPPSLPVSRYDRQQRLAAIGPDGQARLAASTALLVGCGALGTVIADTLVRAGVGRLIICDRDAVELSNLQRQVLFDEADAQAGTPKAQAARIRLQLINRQITVEAVVADVNADNVERLAGVTASDLPRAQVILDGTDNFETRYLLNDVAVKHTIPFVYGGAVQTAGTAMTILPTPPPDAADRAPWHALGRSTPDLRDLWPSPPDPEAIPTCATAGVLGPAVHMIASFQAAEAIKVLTGNWDAVCPRLLHLDLWRNRVQYLDVAELAASSEGICSRQRRFEFLDRPPTQTQTQTQTPDATAKTPSETPAVPREATVLCGSDAIQIAAPSDGEPVDLHDIAERLAPFGRVQATPFLVRVQGPDAGGDATLTVFPDGRCTVKGAADIDAARSIVARWAGL